MGGVRNRHLMKIALVLGVVLLALYLFFSWQSQAKTQRDRLAAAGVEYQELLKNFNKLTDELKHSVQVSAAAKADLSRNKKANQINIAKKDEQHVECMKETRELKADKQVVEEERDSLKDEKSELTEALETKSSELKSVTDELDDLKLSSENMKIEKETCKGELEKASSLLLASQSDGLGASHKLDECQKQLSTAEHEFDACEKRATSLETDNSNKVSEIQQCQAQVLLLQQQKEIASQQHMPAANSEVKRGVHSIQKSPPDSHFEDVDTQDGQKQKTLAGLREKLRNKISLSEQEVNVLQMLTKEDAHREQDSVPPVVQKQKVSVQSDKVSKQPDAQPPPPQPGNGLETVDGPREEDEQAQRSPEQEEIKDLVVEERNKKAGEFENLDMKRDDDFEGGADGGAADRGEEESENYPEEDHNVREDDIHEENNDPLPNPVAKAQEDMDFPDKDSIDDGDEAFKKDQEQYGEEMKKFNHGHSNEAIRKAMQNRDLIRGKFAEKRHEVR